MGNFKALPNSAYRSQSISKRVSRLLRGALEGLGVRVVYVKALSKLAVSREVVREAAETLKGHGVRVVGLVTTAQHTHILGEVAGFLEGEGLKPVIPGVLSTTSRTARLLGATTV